VSFEKENQSMANYLFSVPVEARYTFTECVFGDQLHLHLHNNFFLVQWPTSNMPYKD